MHPASLVQITQDSGGALVPPNLTRAPKPEMVSALLLLKLSNHANPDFFGTVDAAHKNSFYICRATGASDENARSI